MRWDLIDKFEILKKGECARASKSFSGEEDFFAEHFPGRPLVPEPLFIEMIAQAGGVLLGLGMDFKKEVILAKIAHARFFTPVVPPCCFTIEAKIDEEREEGAWISGTIRQKDTLVAETTLLLVTIDAFGDGKNGSIVFNDTFLKHYDVYHVAKISGSLR